MKKIAAILIMGFISLQISYAQVFPFNDDFESYNAFNVPSGYTGNITVYLTHGTLNSKALAGYLTSFTNSDSLIFPAIGPLSMSSVMEFDWRLMDPFLYPSTAASLAPGDSFNILISTDGIAWTSLFSINNSNFAGLTSFEHTILPLNTYSGQIVYFKIKGTRANGSSEIFIDVDNVNVDVPGKIDGPDALNDFKLFPIPARNEVRFSNPFPITGEIEILDASGKIVYTKSVRQMVSGQLDVSTLPAANYNLIVKTKNESKICPLIVR